MSRNFGITRRNFGPARPRLISDWARDVLSGLCLLAFMAGLVVLAIEFPNGIAQLRDLHVAVVAEH